MPLAPGKKPSCGCLGCLGSLLAAVVVPMVAVTVITPWLFQIGERWTPLWRWDGVGRLRDSEEASSTRWYVQPERLSRISTTAEWLALIAASSAATPKSAPTAGRNTSSPSAAVSPARGCTPTEAK